MNNLTVLYYSSNRENEKFEEKIRKNIIKQKGNLPLVSVTQKPISDFGKNICVGIHENSYTSEFMQIRIGLEAIKTPFVITAEADFLYPPEYFNFSPTEKGCYYRYNGVWIASLFDEKPFYHCKGYSDGCQIVDRLYWLELINKSLPNRTDWSQKYLVRCQPNQKDLFRSWTSNNPAISFKTPNGVSKRTQLRKDKPPTNHLPYWGNIYELKSKMFL